MTAYDTPMTDTMDVDSAGGLREDMAACAALHYDDDTGE